MDKYKLISAFNKWFSPINSEKLSISSKKSIGHFNSYRKKLNFEAVLQLFLYAINEEKESLQDLSMSLMNQSLQRATDVESISHSQLSRAFIALDSTVLEEIFQQLLQKVQEKTTPNKRNSFYLIDSSAFSLSLKRHKWADKIRCKTAFEVMLHGQRDHVPCRFYYDKREGTRC